MCSATIDQMRLRLAMNLPFVSQNVSSSGFHSEIQLLIALSFRRRKMVSRFPGEPISNSSNKKRRALKDAMLALPPGQRRCCRPFSGPGRSPWQRPWIRMNSNFVPTVQDAENQMKSSN
jgi:hypothetical protein